MLQMTADVQIYKIYTSTHLHMKYVIVELTHAQAGTQTCMFTHLQSFSEILAHEALQFGRSIRFPRCKTS